MVRTPGANPVHGRDDTARLRSGQAVMRGTPEPLTAHQATDEVASRGVSLFSMELIPRITRAQSMDALSSMATIAGYKAVLLAASDLPRMFPMMNDGRRARSRPPRFVIGAGVAGLQAIASARRLGARWEAYDVRPAVTRAGGEPRRAVRRAAARNDSRPKTKADTPAAQDENVLSPPARADGERLPRATW